MKRILSILTALLMLVTGIGLPCFVPPVSAVAAEEDYAASYEAAVLHYQSEMKQRITEPIVAEVEMSETQYELLRTNYEALRVYYDEFLNKLYMEHREDPALGDYLFNSVLSSTAEFSYYTREDDTTDPATTHYFVEMSTAFNFLTTAHQEQVVSDFVQRFTEVYLSQYDALDDIRDTQYLKVKTLYDFLVRNVVYDEQVFRNGGESDMIYGPKTARNKRSHSAYGAICGSLVRKGKDETDLHVFEPEYYKHTITGEKILIPTDQGLAVCEGFSKLFYYVCKYNGIDCRIVDGDNAEISGKVSDPHEWNYVYLDDKCGDGYKWFNVDATHAEQRTTKEDDVVSYEHFLRGRGEDSPYFDGMNHQQPYEDMGTEIKPQLFDWYLPVNAASAIDYRFPKAAIYPEYVLDNVSIVKRTTVYDESGVPKTAYLYLMKDAEGNVYTYKKEIDEAGNVITTDVEGFGYTGYLSEFDISVPYTIEGTIDISPCTGKEVGEYTISLLGSNEQQIDIPFHIAPLDMNNVQGNYDLDKTKIQKDSPYFAKPLNPTVTIYDAHDNRLTQGTDFDISYYTDKECRHPVSEMKDIGTYYVKVHFFGNYRGDFITDFTITMLDLSTLVFNGEYVPYFSMEYVPISQRGIKGRTPGEYYEKGAGELTMNQSVPLKLNRDFTVSYTGGFDYGDSGTITLTGKLGSPIVKAGSRQSFTYKVDKMYDIGEDYDGKIADTNAVNQYFYTGSPITPTSFDYLDEKLIRGREYEIVSYSDNVDAGWGKVTIKGIGSCTGTATLQFIINKGNLRNASMNASIKNGVATCVISYNGKTLKEGKDYTRSETEDAEGNTVITFTGTGNFGGYKQLKYKKSVAATDVKSVTLYPSVLSKATAGKKKATLKWKKVKGDLTGYEIQVATDSKFKKNLKTYSVSKTATSKVIKSLKSKKTYYFRIRTVYVYKQKKGNKITTTKYSTSWSKAKKAKIK